MGKTGDVGRQVGVEQVATNAETQEYLADKKTPPLGSYRKLMPRIIKG